MNRLQHRSTLFPYTTLFRSTNSPVGTYAMVPGFLDPNGKLTNYTVFPTNGTLTITPALDRKSTRLNYSHRCTSYAVLCVSYRGWLNNDNPRVLSGSPDLRTT